MLPFDKQYRSMISFTSGACLNCWKCLAYDCEMDPRDNYNATRIECPDTHQCMVGASDQIRSVFHLLVVYVCTC